MKTRRFLKGAMLAAVVLTGMAGLYSCSQDEGETPGDGSRVAVQFTMQVAGSEKAVQATAPQVRSSLAATTGTTAEGIAYTDFRAADGFQTRAFRLPTPANGTQNTSGTLRSTSAMPQTRTAAGGTEWTGGDKVGIFMLTASGVLPTNIVGGETTGANNRQYTATAGASATLSPADEASTIYYPQSGNVDFVAYYPYRATPGTDPYLYKVNVATQSTAAEQAAVDVLYVKKTGVSKSHTAVGLAFNHALSKLVINVKSGTSMSGADFGTMGVSLTGFPTTADLALADGTTINSYNNVPAISPLKWAAASDVQFVATYEAIVIPQASGTNRKAVFTVGGETYTWTIPDATAFAQGSTHSYDITVGKTGVTASPGNITPWEGTTATPTPGTAQVFAVKIKAGTFLMGSSDGSASLTGSPGDPNVAPAEPNRGSNETQHSVTLTKDFYMSKYPVTFAQYDVFCDVTGRAKPGDENWGRGNRPVINVTWDDAKAFADWVGGSLPTEAQWEYACRGGLIDKPFGVGDGSKLYADQANFNGAYPYNLPGGHINAYAGAAPPATFMGTTTPVGNYAPNGYGLYDMHGNVWEWCSDRYGNYSIPAGDDPTGPDTGYSRVLRGGCWYYYALFCRSAYRDYDYPVIAGHNIGFRVVFPL